MSTYKSAHAHGGGGVFGKVQYPGDVLGNEHILGLPARGMQSIFELPSCVICDYLLDSICPVLLLLLPWPPILI